MSEENDNVVLATGLTVAWLGNPSTRAAEADVPAFLSSMHRTLEELGRTEPTKEASPPEHVPAVSVRKSLASSEHILSMIDGKPYKTLRRHLSGHGLTPEEYRQRYGLKPDYPMVARGYSEARRSMAVARGLGRKAVEKVEEVVEVAAAKVTRVRGGKAGKAALAGAREARGSKN